MIYEKWEHAAFCVIGREGSTDEGNGFIARLWQEANEHFAEIASYVIYNNEGAPLYLWGLMSDFSRSLKPWDENFSKGLYLAGAQCQTDAPVPAGWSKWSVPAFSYIRVPVQGDAGAAFAEGLKILEKEGLSMAGAAFDMTEPAFGREWVCFPIEKKNG